MHSIWHNVEQNTDEWQALRCGIVTASNFGPVMANEPNAFGEPAKRYALQLALERITGKKAAQGFSNEHTERGHEQEPFARLLYEQEHFCDVNNGGFFQRGNVGDSPDGLIKPNGCLELKSVIAPVHYANLRRGAIDPAYKWQIIGHIWLTERDWCDFGSYCAEFPEDKQLIVYRTERADLVDKIELLETRLVKFEELVLKTIEEIK